MTNEERQTVIQALEAVDALIDHQFTGTSKGMTALQHACDDCRDALGIMRREPVPLTDEEIALAIFEARVGHSPFKRDGSTSFRIARAVERAHGIGAPALRED